MTRELKWGNKEEICSRLNQVINEFIDKFMEK